MYNSTRNNNLVLIQHKVTAESVRGRNEVITWETLTDAWVSINPNRGREIMKGDEKQSIVTHTIRGDFLALEVVKADMRIIYNDTHSYDPISPGSRVFNVLSVMADLDMHKDIMIQVDEYSRPYGELSENITE